MRVFHHSALEWTLRIGAFMCFVGHGAFGVITKEAWVPYFGFVGIPRDVAFTLMPLVGVMDITVGCLVLVRPSRALLWWMTLWAMWTASLRPLTGEPFWEALERAGNYGVPAALLILAGRASSARNLFDPIEVPALTPTVLRRLHIALALTVLLLLVGHGALGVIEKDGIVHNYASVVSAETAQSLTSPLGWTEVGLGVAAATIPFLPMLLLTALWKMLTEALFVTAGAPVWEWVERGGSYAAPLALAIVIMLERSTRASRPEEARPRPTPPLSRV